MVSLNFDHLNLLTNFHLNIWMGLHFTVLSFFYLFHCRGPHLRMRSLNSFSQAFQFKVYLQYLHVLGKLQFENTKFSLHFLRPSSFCSLYILIPSTCRLSFWYTISCFFLDPKKLNINFFHLQVMSLFWRI